MPADTQAGQRVIAQSLQQDCRLQLPAGLSHWSAVCSSRCFLQNHCLVSTAQALVDDDLVHQDKIGTSNFFWAFPSEAAVKVSPDNASSIVRMLA